LQEHSLDGIASALSSRNDIGALRVAVSDTCGSHICGPSSTLLTRVGNMEFGHLKAQDRARPHEVERQKEAVQLKQVFGKKNGI